MTLGLRELSRETAEARYAAAEDGSKFISVLGAKIHYRDQGSGPTLVCIHGVSDSLHTWDGWAQNLASNFRVIRFDLPGFALSTLPQLPLTPDSYIHLLEAFLTQLGIAGRVHVAGNSLGGYVASRFAADFPNRVEKLIVIDPAGYPLRIAPWPIEIAAIPIVRWLAERMTPKSFVKHTARRLFGDKSKATPELVDRLYDLVITEGNRASSFAIFRELVRLRRAYPDHIRRIQAPTLLMWGDRDVWIPVTQAKLWAKDLPAITTRIYDGCGHMPQLEVPELSASDAKAFLL